MNQETFWTPESRGDHLVKARFRSELAEVTSNLNSMESPNFCAIFASSSQLLDSLLDIPIASDVFDHITNDRIDAKPAACQSNEPISSVRRVFRGESSENCSEHRAACHFDLD